MLVVIYDAVDTGRYDVELVARDGRHLPLRELEIEDGEGSVGAVTPIPYRELSEVRVLDGTRVFGPGETVGRFRP